jgi:hypothetical protein
VTPVHSPADDLARRLYGSDQAAEITCKVPFVRGRREGQGVERSLQESHVEARQMSMEHKLDQSGRRVWAIRPFSSSEDSRCCFKTCVVSVTGPFVPSFSGIPRTSMGWVPDLAGLKKQGGLQVPLLR